MAVLNVPSIVEFIKICYLFTRSDLKTVLWPGTAFALVIALDKHRFGRDPPAASLAEAQELMHRIWRLPLAVLFLWVLLLLVDVSNQRQPDSLETDKINKPWRPLARGLITYDAARAMHYLLVFLVPLLAHELGALVPSLAMVFLIWLYNDVRLADINAWLRNLVNGLAYVWFNIAAGMIIAPDGDIQQIAWWATIIGTIIATSVHVQDLEDQVGDAKQGRHTFPTAYGDTATRISVAALMAFWSWYCPTALGLGWLGYMLTFGPASVVWTVLLVDRKDLASRRSWKIYLVWLIILQSLPLLEELNHLGGSRFFPNTLFQLPSSNDSRLVEL